MEYTLQNKFSLIKSDIVKYTSKSPIAIIGEMMHKDYINIHGPEHHFLDDAPEAIKIEPLSQIRPCRYRQGLFL